MRSLIPSFLLLTALLVAGPAAAQDKAPAKAQDKPPAGDKADGGMPPGMDEEAMKRMMETMAPGPHHKHMAPMAGKWKYEMKWWMPGMTDPMTSEGTAETKWLYDGRFLQQEIEGPEEPGPDGKPTKFRGTSISGYDNMTREYTNVWFDNMGTSIMICRGACSDDGKVITMSGEMANPMSGDPREKVRTITRVENEDRHHFAMFSIQKDGKEFKMMEIVYNRVK